MVLTDLDLYNANCPLHRVLSPYNVPLMLITLETILSSQPADFAGGCLRSLGNSAVLFLHHHSLATQPKVTTQTPCFNTLHCIYHHSLFVCDLFICFVLIFHPLYLNVHIVIAGDFLLYHPIHSTSNTVGHIGGPQQESSE